MSPDDFARFFKDHPQAATQALGQFFNAHPEQLDTLRVPHPYGGQAIPLAERQIVGLRERARQFEAKFAELVRFGEENDAIGEKVHRLAVALVGAPALDALPQILQHHLREDFAVPHVVLRLWSAQDNAAQDAALRRHAQSLQAPQCGAAAGHPCVALFGEAAAQLRSLAEVPIGPSCALGLLALASEDAKRFYPEMGTLHLRRIGELCAAAITARR